MIEVKIQDDAISAELKRLAGKSRNLRPVMATIARRLFNITEDAFAQERSPFGPAWKAIQRDGKILQDTGLLAASIARASGKDFAQLSAGRIYAAIHQFGGMAGRGKKTKIEARPYMPINQKGEIPESTRSMILELLQKHLSS